MVLVKYFLDKINFHQKFRIVDSDSEDMNEDFEELQKEVSTLDDDMWTILKRKNWKRLSSLAADIQHFLLQIKESRVFLDYSFSKELENFGDSILNCESKSSSCSIIVFCIVLPLCLI